MEDDSPLGELWEVRGVDEYKYAPFEDDYSIRILTLEPGVEDEPLVGRLSVENLDMNPSYEAISYVWGTKGRSSEMLCDGKVLPLTRSIHGALKRVRHATLPRRLWADQICINQNDIAERSLQVRLMNAIYKGAKHVLVWLGPDKDGRAEAAVRMIHQLREVFEDDEKQEAFKLAHSVDLSNQDQDAWVPLSRLTKLPWFNRIWIVQEIGTTTAATLYWGDAEVDWEVLSLVVAVLNQNYHFLRSRFSILTPNIRYLYRRFVEPEEEYDCYHHRGSFVYELHRARHLQAKDPRDHVYAFLGHFSIYAGSESLRELKADYSRSIEDIFYDVAVRELTGAKSLLLLSAKHEEPLPTRKKGKRKTRLPSWVPDWRRMPLHLLITPDSPHKAAGETHPKLWIDGKTRSLYIRGVRLDTIATRSWIFHGKAFQFRHARTAKLPMEALWFDVCGYKSFDTKQLYLNGDTVLFAMLQTLTNACIGADRSRPYDSVPKSEWLSHGAAYLARAEGSSGLVTPEVHALAEGGDAFKWSHEATLVSRYRRFAVTKEGMFLIGPDSMEDGDVVAVLYGGRTPFVLRPRAGERGEEDGWTLVGECYVHGFMNGEALDREGATEEEFRVV